MSPHTHAPADEPDRAPSPAGGAAPVSDEAVLAFAKLGRLLLDQPLGQFLQKVADLATEVLPGVDGLSVTLVEEGTARSAAFTSSLAAALDERQYEDGFGPCLDAAASGGVVHSGARTAEGRAAYPEFVRVAARLGVVATVSVAMPVPQRVVGALNLYSTTGGVDEQTVGLARAFASYAGVALANSLLHHAAVEQVRQLQQAMESRSTIEQAKGMLMERFGLDADAAFAHLSTLSQDHQTKLRDIAAGVVDGTWPADRTAAVGATTAAETPARRRRGR